MFQEHILLCCFLVKKHVDVNKIPLENVDTVNRFRTVRRTFLLFCFLSCIAIKGLLRKTIRVVPTNQENDGEGKNTVLPSPSQEYFSAVFQK